MDYKTLRKKALLTDVVCIVLAGGVLYLGAKSMLPDWVLVVGLVLALCALVMAVRYSFKARKLERTELNKLIAENERKQGKMTMKKNNEQSTQENV